MLILARKSGEAIVIDNEITVRVLEIKGGQIKLGVDAPAKVRVHREEIYLRILEENRRAGLEGPADLAAFVGSLAGKVWHGPSKGALFGDMVASPVARGDGRTEDQDVGES